MTVARILRFASKWQALIAAGVALFAAAIAYQGAMEKVRSDERQTLKAERRQLRGVLLRLEYTNHSILHEASAFLNDVNSALTTQEKVDQISTIRFAEESNITEAWQSLDLLAPESAQALFNIRICFHNFTDSKEKLSASHTNQPGDDVKREIVTVVVDSLKHLVEFSAQLRQSIAQQLRSIAD